MYGSEASMRLSPGISTPSNRGISSHPGSFVGLSRRSGTNRTTQPCRCLCRGFLQTTRTTFFLLIILQLSQSRLTEGRTFIQIRPYFVPTGDKKTHPTEIDSQERFSFTQNLTYAGR